MAQQVKAFATKHDDLSSIPGTHIAERENWLSHVVLWAIPTLMHTCSVHTHTLNIYLKSYRGDLRELGSRKLTIRREVGEWRHRTQGKEEWLGLEYAVETLTPTFAFLSTVLPTLECSCLSCMSSAAGTRVESLVPAWHCWESVHTPLGVGAL